VLLVGAGELDAQKLRRLAAAGRRAVGMHDGDHDLAGLAEADAAGSSCQRRSRRPIMPTQSQYCAAGRRRHRRCGCRRAPRRSGCQSNVMDRPRAFTLSYFRRSSIAASRVAVGHRWPVDGGRAPISERFEAVMTERIGDLASFIGAFVKRCMRAFPNPAAPPLSGSAVIDGPTARWCGRPQATRMKSRWKRNRRSRSLAGEEQRTAGRGQGDAGRRGPGDPDLLTIKALRALQDADVDLYDKTGIH